MATSGNFNSQDYGGMSYSAQTNNAYLEPRMQGSANQGSVRPIFDTSNVPQTNKGVLTRSINNGPTIQQRDEGKNWESSSVKGGQLRTDNAPTAPNFGAQTTYDRTTYNITTGANVEVKPYQSAYTGTMQEPNSFSMQDQTYRPPENRYSQYQSQQKEPNNFQTQNVEIKYNVPPETKFEQKYTSGPIPQETNINNRTTEQFPTYSVVKSGNTQPNYTLQNQDTEYQQKPTMAYSTQVPAVDYTYSYKPETKPVTTNYSKIPTTDYTMNLAPKVSIGGYQSQMYGTTTRNNGNNNNNEKYEDVRETEKEPQYDAHICGIF